MKFCQVQIDDTIILSDIVTRQIETTMVSDLKHYFPINDNNSRFDLVEIKSEHKNVQPSPHCKLHGAMNCVAIHANGRLWRCIQSNQLKDCRAGCEERI